MELLVRHAAFFKSGNHILMNVQIMPVGKHGGEGALGQPIVEAGGIVREHHLTGVPALAQSGHCGYTILEGKDGVDTKAIHTKVGAFRHYFLEIRDIRGVAGMSDDYAAEIDTLLPENPLLIAATAPAGMSVLRAG